MSHPLRLQLDSPALAFLTDPPVREPAQTCDATDAWTIPGTNATSTAVCVAHRGHEGDHDWREAVEPERTPCSVQDTVAAALIPGDVVLGPDGWVIVGQVDTRTATGNVFIYPAGSSTSFGRAYEDRLAVQPDADTQSSASCQHFIETGRYLRRVAQDVCDGCGQPIEPDDENGHVHADSGLAGCGRPFSDTESYAEPARA